MGVTEAVAESVEGACAGLATLLPPWGVEDHGRMAARMGKKAGFEE